MKAQYERDISRIKDEFETQKKNELDELKHNADQQLAAFVSGGGDGDGDAKQRLEALKLRNDEELKSLQDSIAVDKRAQKKSRARSHAPAASASSKDRRAGESNQRGNASFAEPGAG